MKKTDIELEGTLKKIGSNSEVISRQTHTHKHTHPPTYAFSPTHDKECKLK